jgi:hypothetical protein
MKYLFKIIIVLFLVSISLPIVNAQDNYLPDSGLLNTTKQELQEDKSLSGFHFGLKFQPFINSLNFKGSDGQNASMEQTVNSGWGASLNYFFSPWIGLHLEVMNMRQKFAFDDGLAKRRIDLNYIQIPLLLSVNTNLEKWVNLNLTAGPYIGLNTNTSINYENQLNEVFSNGSAAVPVLIVNPLEVGVAYGAGLDFGFGEGQWLHLNMGYRGTMGLTNIQDQNIVLEGKEYGILAKTARNATAGFYVGVMAKF